LVISKCKQNCLQAQIFVLRLLGFDNSSICYLAKTVISLTTSVHVTKDVILRFFAGMKPGKKLRIGVHRERETPVPIPNTAVKPFIGYNTWVLALGK
jgi:hypothetical protein